MGTDQIDEFTVIQRAKARAAFTGRLLELFQELDVSGDGNLSHEEFQELLHVDQVSAWMDLLEISTKDIDNLFMAVDDGDGNIDMQEFVKGFNRLQGGATAVDAI